MHKKDLLKEVFSFSIFSVQHYSLNVPYVHTKLSDDICLKITCLLKKFIKQLNIDHFVY